MPNLKLDQLKDNRVEGDLGRVIWWGKAVRILAFRII